MAFIPDVHLAGSFVNLNTETGLAVNQNFFIQWCWQFSGWNNKP